MTDPVDVAADAAVDLRILVGRLHRRFNDLYDEQTLPAPQIAVLGRLLQDGPAAANDLARAERVRPQSMAATLAALEAQGVIARTPDPNDGRRKLIEVTEAGRAAARASRGTREQWLIRSLLDEYTDDERATIAKALKLLGRLTA